MDPVRKYAFGFLIAAAIVAVAAIGLNLWEWRQGAPLGVLALVAAAATLVSVGSFTVVLLSRKRP